MSVNLDADKISQTSDELLERESTYKEALRLLLDWQRDRKAITSPCQREWERASPISSRYL